MWIHFRYGFVDDYFPVNYSNERESMKYYKENPEEFYKPVEYNKPEPVQPIKPKLRRALTDPYDPR